MVFPNIEKIKQEYTDKYVVVDAREPELSRFADVVGQVKTVNMSGRALVEFLDYHLNIGWFDIDLDYLKIVDKPIPQEKKPEPKKAPAAKPAAAKKPAEKPPGKPSTADILAKLKGGGAAKPAAGEATQTAAKPKPKAESKPTGAADRSKMSVADMLAAARGGAAPKAEAAPAEAEPEPAPVEEAPPAKSESAPKAEGGIVKIDKSGMSIEEMVAYCREHDAA
ncbi:hypothetical protein [Bythopirellula goksoeyrii]|uniref:Uncharacterized protein n=1 Tax=Bythopirellula goksoeyrii TaxID=1400387 RepID=A0A5B9QVA2_9BACT|nr:hypothetical protein [Bythopirellula goksoeyrii]QEG37863.1 hypothetical protein Pr1d_52110 [Bythopirellula goksoeyrii]